MSEVKELKEAWSGDLIEVNGVLYRVLDAQFDPICYCKIIKAVKAFPKFSRILFVHEFVV